MTRHPTQGAFRSKNDVRSVRGLKKIQPPFGLHFQMVESIVTPEKLTRPNEW